MADTQITPETAPVGARLLVRSRYTGFISEVTVLEWSPSVQRVRLHYAGGSKVWDDNLPYFVEALPLLIWRDEYGHIHRSLNIAPTLSPAKQAVIETSLDDFATKTDRAGELIAAVWRGEGDLEC